MNNREAKEKAILEAAAVFEKLAEISQYNEEGHANLLKRLEAVTVALESKEEEGVVDKLYSALEKILVTEEEVEEKQEEKEVKNKKFSLEYYNAVYETLLSLVRFWPKNNEHQCPISLGELNEENRVLTSTRYQYDKDSLKKYFIGKMDANLPIKNPMESSTSFSKREQIYLRKVFGLPPLSNDFWKYVFAKVRERNNRIMAYFANWWRDASRLRPPIRTREELRESAIATGKGFLIWLFTATPLLLLTLAAGIVSQIIIPAMEYRKAKVSFSKTMAETIALETFATQLVEKYQSKQEKLPQQQAQKRNPLAIFFRQKARAPLIERSEASNEAGIELCSMDVRPDEDAHYVALPESKVDQQTGSISRKVAR